MKAAGIRVRLHHDVVAAAHIREIGLIDIRQHPDRAQVGNGEGLRLARLHHLAGRDQPLHHLAADRREHRNLRRRRRLRQVCRDS